MRLVQFICSQLQRWQRAALATLVLVASAQAADLKTMAEIIYPGGFNVANISPDGRHVAALSGEHKEVLRDDTGIPRQAHRWQRYENAGAGNPAAGKCQGADHRKHAAIKARRSGQIWQLVFHEA